MSIIDFEKAKAAKVVRDAARLASECEANQEAEQWAALTLGFQFCHAGEDRWGNPVYSVVHDGSMIVDGRAELGLEDALALVGELLEHCTSPDQYQRHAACFAAVVAELRAEADAAIEAEQ